jgi:hypothetical protein
MMQSMRQIASAGAIAALLLTAGCGPRSGPDPAESINPTAGRTSDVPVPDSDVPAVIHFDEGDIHEVFIEQPSDVDKLRGTSPEFKAFVAAQVENLASTPATSECEIGVGVAAYAPSGFARGSVSACGGYAALWGIRDGRWKELIGTQDLWSCADLRKFKVPVGLVDTCYQSMKEVPYTG